MAVDTNAAGFAAPNGDRPTHLGRGGLICLLLLLQAPLCHAGIDHLVPYDDSGIWSRTNQEIIEYGLPILMGGAALWEGGESRFGRTMWQSTDAFVASGVISIAMKYAFSRVRPRDSGPGGNPDLWFKGQPNQSFPSGEVTSVTSIVTPVMLEYGKDQPAVYALALLPIYDGIARVKVQAHWQTDVLAGAALGAGAGWLMHRNPGTPYILSVMPHGIYIGLSKSW